MAVAQGSLGAHAPACGAQAIERIRELARPLAGARVLHVSAAAGGGRVPELLGSLLPLMADAGLAVEWRVLFGSPDVLGVARSLRDGLQGAETALEEPLVGSWRDASAAAAEDLPEHDVLVLHDPGTLAIAAAAGGPAVWHCHVDASEPDPPAWETVEDLARACAERVVPAAAFAPPGLEDVRESPPGIDPLSVRNLELAPRLAGRVLRPLGVDLEHPFVCQAMRLDRWKDPHETLEAFELIRDDLPALQLVLAFLLESGGADDWHALREVSDYAEDSKRVLLLTSYAGLGNLELGALQRLARVGLQRALREGFGLAASEALWKGTPVVGGRDGGVPLQVRDGVDGYLTGGAEETAERVVELVRDPGLAIDMGLAGQERVREHFLVTRSLEDELRLMAGVLGATVDSR
jgi:trehalose synthase